MIAAVAFLLMDLQTGAVISTDWPDREKPLPVGSLVKLFTALEYAQSHQFEYPQVTCKRCWSGRAHGRIGITEAVAQSCNSYFLAIAGKVPEGTTVGSRFGISAPAGARPEMLIGLEDDWTATPTAILKAYAELLARRGEPGVAPLLEGMRLSAMSGTGKGIALDALVKTGTAACRHLKRAPGDGYAVALYPREQPRLAILVQIHSRPGAHAAIEAGRLLRSRNVVN